MIVRNERNNGINNTVLLILLIFIMTWSLVPMVHQTVDRLYLIIAVAFALLVVSLRRSLSGYVTPSEYNLLVLMGAWVTYQCMFKIAMVSEAAWGTHSEFIIFYIMYLLYLYVKYNFSYKYMKTLAVIGYALIFATITHYFYTNLNGGLQTTYDPVEQSLEIIPTMFKQEVLIFSGGCLSMFFLVKSKLAKIIGIVGLASSFWVSYIVGNNATSTFLMAIMLLLMIVSRMGKNAKSGDYKVYISAVIILVIVIFAIAGDQILGYLASITEQFNPRISRKLLSLAQLLHGGKQIAVVAGDSLSSRLFCMGISLKTWLRNPITFLFGVGRKNGYYYDSGIGQHSEFIDVFARFGIIGAVITFAIFVKLFCCLKNGRNSKTAHFCSIVYSVLMLLGFLNNFVFPQIGAVIFFVWILTLDLIDAKDGLCDQLK